MQWRPGGPDAGLGGTVSFALALKGHADILVRKSLWARRPVCVESKERNIHNMEPPRCNSAMSGGFVRPVSPEDVYDDRQRSFMSASVMSNHRPLGISHSSHSSLSSLSLNSSQGYPRANPYLSHAPPPPALRQTSSSSAGNTTISGSENWETFDDASDAEADASDVYYAKIRAAHGKRFAPDDSMDFMGKKSKGIRSVSPDGPHPGQVLRVAGSNTEWTDGETKRAESMA